MFELRLCKDGRDGYSVPMARYNTIYEKNQTIIDYGELADGEYWL